MFVYTTSVYNWFKDQKIKEEKKSRYALNPIKVCMLCAYFYVRTNKWIRFLFDMLKKKKR